MLRNILSAILLSCILLIIITLLKGSRFRSFLLTAKDRRCAGISIPGQLQWGSSPEEGTDILVMALQDGEIF